MAQASASTYPATEQRTADKVKNIRDKASAVADDVSSEAKTLVDRVVAYTKANPVEAAAVAAGVAFVAGAAILGPRLLQSRRERDFSHLLRQAYREAERIRDDSATWNKLTDWVRANVPSSRSWR